MIQSPLEFVKIISLNNNKWTGQSLNLDVKLIADFGMIEFPNAWKSTLLNLVFRAKSKIADYPCKSFEYWTR